MSTRRSIVKWFDAKKGYGFIHHPDGEDDIFVHYSTIASDKRFKTLRTGQSVDFDLQAGPKGLHAHNVIGLDEFEDDLIEGGQATADRLPVLEHSGDVMPQSAQSV